MIIVKNRELLIPEYERYIGTTYDTKSEIRQFILQRFAQNGVDLSALTFRLDLKYANDSTDTVFLGKEVNDSSIILTWTITSSVLQVPGTLFIQIRAIDGEATVKWSSFLAAIYVERHLNTPGSYTGDLTEIEQMEQDYIYMKSVVDTLKNHIDYTFESEAWAKGSRNGSAVTSGDVAYHNNSKYYKDQALSGAMSAAISAEHASAYVGAPLVADSAADMTDHSRIYVYAGSEDGYTFGDWYYWDGEAFSDGGVYNSIALSTDKTLFIADKAADAKEVGDRFKYSVVEKDGILVDNAGDFFSDNLSNNLSGNFYYPVTDSTGKLAGIPADSGMVGKTFLMGIGSMGLPIMYLSHPDIEMLQSKSDGDLANVGIVFSSKGINTTLKKFKVQGASSQSYPKKNYTITFNSNVKLNDSWGYHKKYVIKADWVDFSHMRNEIGAKLWGKVRGTRVNQTRSKLVNGNGDNLVNNGGLILAGDNDPSMSIGLNYGAVDGYPICVYINGQYWGIYSLMVPKDDWMAGMIGKNDYEAIVSAENHSVPTQFGGLVEAPNEDGEMYDTNHTRVAYSMEYVTDEDDMSWLSTSLNTLISAVMATYSTPEECLETIGQYIDIDSAVDYMIFNCMINNIDGLDKNFLLDTWDGTKWYFAAYDMDGTFGNNWDGKSYIPATGGCTFAEYANTSKLMRILYDYAPEIIKERYRYLRGGVLSEANFADMVWNYTIKIPDAAFNYETVRWPSRPGTHTNNHEQILRYYQLRCAALDAEIATL